MYYNISMPAEFAERITLLADGVAKMDDQQIETIRNILLDTLVSLERIVLGTPTIQACPKGES